MLRVMCTSEDLLFGSCTTSASRFLYASVALIAENQIFHQKTIIFPVEIRVLTVTLWKEKNLTSIVSLKEQLAGDWNALSNKWTSTKALWDDRVSRSFEKQYWETLNRCTQETLTEMEQLARTIFEARRKVHWKDFGRTFAYFSLSKFTQVNGNYLKLCEIKEPLLELT